jgi:hypothetical protein
MNKYFFDLDNTICESRTKITGEMFKLLKQLKGEIVVISGAETKQIKKQIGNLTKYIMGQSGSETPYWNIKLIDKEKKEILNHIKSIQEFFPKYVGEDLIQDRGCQISFSFVGHNADLDKKRAFDKNGVFRKSVLKTFPFISETLECRVAGTTCLDYTLKEYTKGKNIERFIANRGWNKDECIYFGDALWKGGNDESVIGVIPVCEVANPTDLMVKLKEYV